MRLLFLFATVAFFALFNAARAADPFLKPGDVIALVGGEDMVVASELGYLETLIQRALPAYKLKFRSLAWEGDTVFEQQRDLNYPKLEDQLDKIGATVVICQFGEIESLAGKEKVPDFIAAYRKMITRLSGGGKRRIILLSTWDTLDGFTEFPQGFSLTVAHSVLPTLECSFKYLEATENAASAEGVRYVKISDKGQENYGPYRGILHLNTRGHERQAHIVALQLVEKPEALVGTSLPENLRALITAKNKLWFNYYRPQNWAFLAGDRTNQPSSRDHKDPSKRWFPEELEKFIPLIEAKEQEIWALAEKLSKEGGAK